MKRLFSLLTLTVISCVACGQPTITNAEDFTIGTMLKFQKCSTKGVSLGTSGTDQTWDYSKLNTIADTVWEYMADPASTKNGKLFPEANLAEKYSDGRCVYVNKTYNQNFLVGYADTASLWATTYYSDPMLFATRPLNYGTIITDSFTLKGGASNGVITIDPDGYGTLILPNGRFKNVLRVKITEIHPMFTYTGYFWFDGIHTSALLKIDSEPSVEYLLKETVPVKKPD